MDIKKLLLSQVSVNSGNPRSINKQNFNMLVDSLLSLPKMMELRPIVVDNTNTALGGNMRYRALCAIDEMGEDELRKRIEGLNNVKKKTQVEQDALINFWIVWKDKPWAYTVSASQLSDAEQKEFIIKDNLSFGDWNYERI